MKEDELAAFIERITREAGDAILPYFGKVDLQQSTKKDPGDILTEADLLANKMIVGAIKERFPEHSIVSEEEPATDNGSEYTWYIDPIDGTRNFSRHTPLWAVMVALARGETTEYGAIYLPVTKEFYFAKRGEGAFLNGKRIECSKTERIEHSFGIQEGVIPVDVVHRWADFEEKMQWWSTALNSAGVCAVYTATGKRDWYFCGKCGGTYDMAPGILIMQEAGCLVTDWQGNPWKLSNGPFISANPVLHKKLIRMSNQ